MLKTLMRIVLPVIALIIAGLGILGIKPFNIQYSDTQLIVVLMGLLAIDAVVERTEILRTTESMVRQIHHRVVVGDNSGITFATRLDQERLPELLATAKKSIWIVGPSLDSIVDCQRTLAEQLRAGREVRILMVEPTDDLVEWYGKHVVGPTYAFDSPEDRRRAKDRIVENRDRLLKLGEVNSKKFSMRVLDRILWFGYIIIDAGHHDGRMDVQLYMYKTPADQAPILRFDSESSQRWYGLFFEQYKLYWDSAKKIFPAR